MKVSQTRTSVAKEPRAPSAPPAHTIRLASRGRVVRGRQAAEPVRQQIAAALARRSQLRLDFAGISSMGTTFADQVLGTTLARYGTSALRLLVFANCSAHVQANILVALKGLVPLELMPVFE